MGMGCSLFEWLDRNDENKAGSVELVHQYRMNRPIMDLANRVTYSGKLQCVSDEIANARVEMNAHFMKRVSSERIKSLLFTESVVFLDTSELMRPILNERPAVDAEASNENKTVNRTECALVRDLCQIFYRYSDCNLAEQIGIIAPYNNQVKEIQAQCGRLSPSGFFKQIEVNTVDQFQGRDKKVIIMSFTNSVIRTEDTKVSILKCELCIVRADLRPHQMRKKSDNRVYLSYHRKPIFSNVIIFG